MLGTTALYSTEEKNLMTRNNSASNCGPTRTSIDTAKDSIRLYLGADPASKVGGGAISAIFGSLVSLRVHYCKRDEVYFTTVLWQDYGRQNGLKSRMLFPELYKIMVKTVTFIGFRGRSPQSPPWIHP